MSQEEKFVCIAVDMGASNIRIMAGILDGVKIEYREVHRFSNEITEKDGHERWDIESIFNHIMNGIEIVIDEFGNEVKSVGVDAWGVDLALLDADGELVDQPVAYRDRRTEGMEELWTGTMSRRETFERTGINFYIFNTLFQLLSFRESGLPPGTTRLLFLPNYILYRISGVMMNELTISSTSQLLNVDTDKWDEKILDLLEVPDKVLGDVCLPGTVLGDVYYGKNRKIEIKATAVCSHDTASAVAAVPAVEDSFAFISTGTWCIVGMESRKAITSSQALEEGFTNERGYGNTYRFLKNIIGLWLVQGLKGELAKDLSYEEIEAGAASSHGGLLVVPGDSSFYNPGSMKQAFDDFFSKTGQKIPSDPFSYFRAAYDSLVYSFRYHIEKMEEMTGKTISSIHLIGGGCQSKYLSSRTSNICGRIVHSGPVEAATIGNIIVQAIALDHISNLKQARSMVRDSFDVRTYQSDLQGAEMESSNLEYSHFLELRREIVGK
jgi:rhamnulokinase